MKYQLNIFAITGKCLTKYFFFLSGYVVSVIANCKTYPTPPYQAHLDGNLGKYLDNKLMFWIKAFIYWILSIFVVQERSTNNASKIPVSH